MGHKFLNLITALPGWFSSSQSNNTREFYVNVYIFCYMSLFCSFKLDRVRTLHNSCFIVWFNRAWLPLCLHHVCLFLYSMGTLTWHSWINYMDNWIWETGVRYAHNENMLFCKVIILLTHFGWKKRMTTQNRQKSNAKNKFKKSDPFSDYFFGYD